MADGLPAPRATLVIGTRPELIKLAPVARALAARGMRASLLLTGQHPSLDPVEAGLGGFAHVRLSCDLAGSEPFDAAETIATACGSALEDGVTDWVVVQGDTTSALGGARAAARLGLPLAHVEAGLRTGDPSQPWPEEPMRVEIDRLSDVLFAPTTVARDNLVREGVRGRVLVTGNTGVDALRADWYRLPPVRVETDVPPLVLLTVHRRENLDAVPAIADGLARAIQTCPFRLVVPVHPNPQTAALARRAFAGLPFATLAPPQPRGAFLSLLSRARVVLSDSGGLNEEAPTLGIPLLILREKTERPEAVASGNARLVGTDPARIAAELTRLLADPAAHAAMAMPRDLFGDGRAAALIADDLASRRALAA